MNKCGLSETPSIRSMIARFDWASRDGYQKTSLKTSSIIYLSFSCYEHAKNVVARKTKVLWCKMDGCCRLGSAWPWRVKIAKSGFFSIFYRNPIFYVFWTTPSCRKTAYRPVHFLSSKVKIYPTIFMGCPPPDYFLSFEQTQNFLNQNDQH